MDQLLQRAHVWWLAAIVSGLALVATYMLHRSTERAHHLTLAREVRELLPRLVDRPPLEAAVREAEAAVGGGSIRARTAPEARARIQSNLRRTVGSTGGNVMSISDDWNLNNRQPNPVAVNISIRAQIEAPRLHSLVVALESLEAHLIQQFVARPLNDARSMVDVRASIRVLIEVE